jgi:hypothetical protein
VRDDWYFSDGTQKPSQIHERELVSRLSARTIPSDAFLWHPGWKRWMRANRVAQFSTILRELALVPEPPSFDSRVRTPPPLPSADEATAQAEVEPLRVRFSTPVPPPPHIRPQLRRPTPAPIEEPAERSGTGTLRPPGAVPPPPMGANRGPETREEFEELDPTELHSDRSLRPQPLPGDAAARILGETRVTEQAASQRLALTGTPTDLPREEVSSPLVSESDLATVPRHQDPQRSETVHEEELLTEPVPTRPRTTYLLLGVASIAFTIGVFGTLLTTRPGSPSGGAVTATAKAPPLSTSQEPRRVEAPRAPGCVIVQTARRIAPLVQLGVVPNLQLFPEGDALSIGLASTRNTATGVRLELATLTASFPFQKVGDAEFQSVVPADHGAYLVADTKSALAQPHPVAAARAFTLGATDQGLARVRDGSTLALLWPLPEGRSLTEPRVATSADGGHAVALRAGGLTGRIVFGWLSADGELAAPPVELQPRSRFVGNPSLGISSSGAVVTFARRDAEEQSWGIGLGRVPAQGTPGPVEGVPVPAGGPGGDAIAPCATLVGPDALVLTWFEGAAGAREARTQLLDRSLSPVGAPLTISPPNTNAGLGAMVTTRDQVVVVFVASQGSTGELWAASLSCTP